MKQTSEVFGLRECGVKADLKFSRAFCILRLFGEQDVARLQVKHESLILAQSERWRRA